MKRKHWLELLTVEAIIAGHRMKTSFAANISAGLYALFMFFFAITASEAWWPLKIIALVWSGLVSVALFAYPLAVDKLLRELYKADEKEPEVKPKPKAKAKPKAKRPQVKSVVTTVRTKPLLLTHRKEDA